MSSPVMDDDVVQGVCKWLATFEDVTSLVGSAPDGTPYIFQDTLHAVLEDSQQAAVVFSTMGGWAAPHDYNTMEFPRLLLDLWVDPIRDANNNYVELAETRRRARKIYAVLNQHLHRPQVGGPVYWGTVRTIGCTRLGEVVIAPVPDGDGLIRAQVFYGVILG